MWTSPFDITESLYKKYPRYDFFQFARWLLLYRPKPNESRMASRVKFEGSTSLAFPESEIESVEYDGKNDIIVVRSPVFGLTGSAGTLPYHDLDTVAGPNLDENYVEFLNLFQDRLFRLLYDVWRKNRPDIDLQHQLVQRRQFGAEIGTPLQVLQSGRHEPPTEDQFTRVQLSLAGFLHPADGFEQGSQLAFPPTIFATLNAYFAQPARSAAAIEGILRTCLGVPIEVHSFVPRRLPQPEADRTVLGQRLGGGQGYNQLGMDAILGDIVWDFQSQFDIVVGPLNARQFADFNPWAKGSDSEQQAGFFNGFGRLRQLVTGFVGNALDFGVRLKLLPEATRPASLGQAVLGYNTWLGDSPAEELRTDPYFLCQWN